MLCHLWFVNLQWAFNEPSMNLRWTFNEPSMNLWWTFYEPSMNLWIQSIWFCVVSFLLYFVFISYLYKSESDVFVSGKNCSLFGGPQCPVFATICADDRFAQVLLLTPVQKVFNFWKTDNLYCPYFVVKERMQSSSN